MKEIILELKKWKKKSTPEVRHRRKQLRPQRTGFANIAEQIEGVVYGAGLFWLFWNTHFNLDNVFFFWIYQYFWMEQYRVAHKNSNFYKNKETFKVFSLQLLEVYRILLLETALESIMFYYNFSVINTMFVLCTALLYGRTSATRTLKLFTILLSISCWIHLISLLMVSSLACGLMPPYFSNRTLEYLRHNFPCDRLISQQTDNSWVSLSKISTRLTIFWGDTWKTEFVKTIHRQERTSSQKKSDGFQKKCSIELWTILMLELLLYCHIAAQCMERT